MSSAISLLSHREGYQLDRWDVALCAVTCFTAVTYTLRHMDQAFENGGVQWGHFVIGFFECMPVLGPIIALIEYCIYGRGIFSRTMSNQAQPEIGESHAKSDQLSGTCNQADPFESTIRTQIQKETSKQGGPHEICQSNEKFEQLSIKEQQRIKTAALKMLQSTSACVFLPQSYNYLKDSLPAQKLWLASNAPSDEFYRLLREAQRNHSESRREYLYEWGNASHRGVGGRRETQRNRFTTGREYLYEWGNASHRGVGGRREMQRNRSTSGREYSYEWGNASHLSVGGRRETQRNRSTSGREYSYEWGNRFHRGVGGRRETQKNRSKREGEYPCEWGTVLHLAVSVRNLAFVKCILNSPESRKLIDINQADVSGNTPLMLAARSKNYDLLPIAKPEEMVELLLDHDANTNCLDSNCATPLFRVITNGGNPSLIQKFLQHHEATLHFSADQPDPALSDAEWERLSIAYRNIEMALQEGLNAVVTHRDLHSIVSSYYWRG